MFDVFFSAWKCENLYLSHLCICFYLLCILMSRFVYRKEITVLGVTQGQNESVFTINPPVMWCHKSVQVYRADLLVTSTKLDTSQALCLVANDSVG